MYGPGRYVPDPTEGMTNVNDLPAPQTRGVSSRPEANSLPPVLSSRLAAQIWTAHVA